MERARVQGSAAIFGIEVLYLGGVGQREPGCHNTTLCLDLADMLRAREGKGLVILKTDMLHRIKS